MCGILGYFSLNKPVSAPGFTEAAGKLAHRGPDAGGFYFASDHRLALGHRRLSVIDLRAVANQPMKSPNGRYAIIFNGEVYNYRELRMELMRYGVGPFRTDSDTEVILQAWLHWGPEAASRFNGMFAFAIWDGTEETLWLCRDRVGIKPLFIDRSGDTIIFASELKALLPLCELGGFHTEINQDAIAAFLHLGFIPSPSTIYKGVEKFPSGHYASFGKGGTWKTAAYWQAEDQMTGKPLNDPSQALEQLEELLTSSVRYRMIADVPFGAFLSGGTDSSLVTAIASKLSPQPLKTFSIGFKESKFNESRYAKAVAAHLNTDHTSYILEEKEAAQLLAGLLPAYDEPFADTSAIPTMLISKLARQEATVVLTGDGGDELFHGYGAYRWANRLHSPLMPYVSGLIYQMLRLTGISRFQRIAHLFEPQGHTSVRDHIFSQEQYFFSNAELDLLLINGLTKKYIYKDPGRLPSSMSHAARQAFFDLQVYLPDDLLVKVDRATMKYGLEARVPLLDYRIIRFALNLSDDLKINDREQKWLLKKLLEKYLPRELVYRPKWGFSIPLANWLKGGLRYLIEDYLNKNIVTEVGLVHHKEIRRLIRNFEQGNDYLFNRLWLLITLHLWFKTYNSERKN